MSLFKVELQSCQSESFHACIVNAAPCLKGFVLSLWVTQLSLSLSSQTIAVQDATTRTPLAGVVAYHPSTGISKSSSEKGLVDLSQFVAADSIHFRLLGYQPLVLSAAELQRLDHVVLMEPEPMALKEFVVSANRWEQDASKVPKQITVFRPRDVTFHNPGTSADLLETSGEVFVQRSQLGGGSPMLRGFAANRVLIVVDGVRMNNAIYRGGNLQNLISVDPNALERAEVVHGPGAMTYGSDAIGGVMDFNMLRPRFSNDSGLTFQSGVLARYGSAARERTGHLHYGLGGRKLAFIASATVCDLGDLRAGSHGEEDYLRPWYVRTVEAHDSVFTNPDPRDQIPSSYTNLMTLAKLAYRPAKDLEIGLNGYWSTTSDIPRYDRLIEMRPNSYPRSAEWYYGPQLWRMVSLNVQHRSHRGLYDRSRLLVAWQDYGESRHDRNFGSTSLRVQEENVLGLWVNLDLEKELGEETQILYGAEAVGNRVGSAGYRTDILSGSRTPLNSRYPDGSTWYSASVYAGVIRETSEQVTLSVGLRYNFAGYDCVFDTTLFPFPVGSASLTAEALTGNVGVSFRPTSDWKLSADLSTGFRSPNIDDVAKVFDSAPGVLVVPNPDLKPEYAYSGEIAAERKFPDRAIVSVGGYAVLLDAAIVRRPYALNGEDSVVFDDMPSGVEALVNAARAKVVGVFIATDVRVSGDLVFEVRYNWQRGVEQDDENTADVPLRHAPPPFGRAGITWHRSRWRVQMAAYFSGGFDFEQLPPSEKAKLPIYAQDDQGRPYAPSWVKFDIRGRYLVCRGLEVTGGVENFTDVLYRPYSSGISAPGRNVVLALRYAL